MVLCSCFYPIVSHTGKRAEAKVYATSLREARRGRGEKSAGRRSAMVEGFLRDMVTSYAHVCRRGRTTMGLIQTSRLIRRDPWPTYHGYYWDIHINMTCTGMSCAFSIRVAFLTYIIVLVRLFILLRVRHKLHSSFKPCTMIEINRRTGTLKATG